MTDHHLLVVANQFDETVGGLETHLQELLPRLAERDVGVTLVYLGSSPPRHWGGVDILTMRRRLDFRATLAVPDPRDLGPLWRKVMDGRLSAGPVTHIATHTRFFPMSWLGRHWAQRLQVPLLHTEHGGGPVATSPRAVAHLSNAVDRTLGRAVLRSATRVLAVSKASAAFVADLADVPCHVLGNGIRLRDWLPDETSPRVPRGERDLVFAGRFIREKGWEDFLQVVRELRSRDWQGQAVIAGAGPDEEEIARRLRAIPGARLAGRVGARDLAALLRGAVLVNPSRAAEGFQLIQLEAVAAGASLVGYPVGIGPELAALDDVDATMADDVRELTREVWAAVHRPAPRPPGQTLRRWDWDTVAAGYRSHLDDLAARA